MADRDFVKAKKKSSLLGHLKNIDDATAKWRKDLLDAVVTKDELVLQIGSYTEHGDLQGRSDANQHPASAVQPDTSGFGGQLSAADDTVQKALDTLDNIVVIGGDTDAIHVNIDNEISGIGAKTAPVSTDIFVIEDSEDSFNKKSLAMGNITVGGVYSDAAIDFDEVEGYTGDPVGLPDEYEKISVQGDWENVSPPEPDIGEASWRSMLAQPCWWDGDWQANDSCAHAGYAEAQEYCARYLPTQFADGVLDVWFRFQCDHNRFCGIGVISQDSYDESGGVYCGGVGIKSSPPLYDLGPNSGFVLTTDIREDEGWYCDDPAREKYNNTKDWVKDAGNVVDIAFAFHLRIKFNEGWAGARQWDGSWGVEAGLYPDDDNDWDQTVGFSHSLGDPCSIYLISKEPPLYEYGVETFVRCFYLRFIHSVDGIILSEGIQHDDLGGLLDDDHLQYLLEDGTRPLSGDWDAGDFTVTSENIVADDLVFGNSLLATETVTGETLVSTVTVGTPPLSVISTTTVTNLDSDTIDGDHTSEFFHNNESGEIDALESKVYPSGDDIILIEDNLDSFSKAKLAIADVPYGTESGTGEEIEIYWEIAEGYITGGDHLHSQGDWSDIVGDLYRYWIFTTQTFPGGGSDRCASTDGLLEDSYSAIYDASSWTSGIVSVYFQISGKFKQFGGIYLGDNTLSTNGIYFGLVTFAGGDTVGFYYGSATDPEVYHTHWGAPNDTTAYWIRAYVDIDKDLGKMKAWTGDIEDEPGAWDVERTFTSPISNPLYLSLHATNNVSSGCNVRIWKLLISNPITSFGYLGTLDHGNIEGIADDDHEQYLLASDATDRATFAANWTDLTDTGETTLHTHPGGAGNDEDAIHDNVSGEINAIASKSPVVDDDIIIIEDSEDLWAKKKVALSEISSGTGSHNHDSDYISILDDPIAGNFASLTNGGEIEDSGYDGSDFALYGHNHDTDYISIIDTPAANHFPYQTSGGELIDSTYSASDFAGGSHNHDSNYISIIGGEFTEGDIPTINASGELIDSKVLLSGLQSSYVEVDGTSALTAAWDAGSFQIRAETFQSDVATGTAPLTVASTTKVTNLNADQLDGLHDTSFLKAAGSVALTADWDAGSYEIRAQTFESDVATGTAPLTIASTTACTNLNADLLDGNHAAAFLTAVNPVVKMTIYNSSIGSFAAGDLLYISGASGGNPSCLKADADAEASASKMLVVCNAAINASATGEAIAWGYVSGLSSLTAGAIYYVSTTIGQITTTAPTGSADIVRIVGYALSTTELFFNPDATYVELI